MATYLGKGKLNFIEELADTVYINVDETGVFYYEAPFGLSITDLSDFDKVYNVHLQSQNHKRFRRGLQLNQNLHLHQQQTHYEAPFGLSITDLSDFDKVYNVFVVDEDEGFDLVEDHGEIVYDSNSEDAHYLLSKNFF